MTESVIVASFGFFLFFFLGGGGGGGGEEGGEISILLFGFLGVVLEICFDP